MKGSQTLPAAATPPPALLAEITADLAAGEDLRALLDRFLGPLVELAHARAGSVRMLSADCTRFELVSTLGLPAPLDQAEHHADRHCGFCGRSADQGHAIWTRELQGCAARTGDSFFGGTCHGALAVPLRHGPRVLGVYNLFFEGDAEPDPTVLALLRSVGDLLGLALEKHRLEAENLRAAVAHERQLMAAEVHDALAQNLTFVKLRLPLLRDAIEAGRPEGARAYLADIDETLADAHGSLRQIITQFRTGIDPRGLAPALAALGGRFTQRTGIPLELDDGLCALRLPQADQVEVFHIVQEALANMERHAHARHGWLSLLRAPGRIEIRVEDDGVGTGGTGARTDVDRAHHGLDIMRERAQRLGGVLTIGPRPGGGTLVRCSLPAREKA